MAQLHYAPARATWAGSYRDEIPSRCEPHQQPERYIGRLLIDLPGFSLDWALPQDMRDLRRFYARDLDGNQHQHCAPRELMRRVALIVPKYCAARD